MENIETKFVGRRGWVDIRKVKQDMLYFDQALLFSQLVSTS